MWPLVLGVGLLSIFALNMMEEGLELERPSGAPQVTPQSPDYLQASEALFQQLKESASYLPKVPQFEEVARSVLMFQGDRYAAMVVPSDQSIHPSIPTMERYKEMGSALAEAYECGFHFYPMGWAEGRAPPVEMCVLVFYDRDIPLPPEKEVLARVQEKFDEAQERLQQSQYQGYGFVQTLMMWIAQAFVMAGVGTATSMGVSALIRSAGGEPRLARLMRRFKRLPEGHRKERLKEKIVRTGKRLIGKHVDWDEVNRLIGEWEAKAEAAR
jgi:hypothetical protein